MTKKIIFLAFWLILFCLSARLMFGTFSVNQTTSQITMGDKLWSDFGAHLPLIRSFSFGANLPRLVTGQIIEHPLYPGEPIKYHFFFYALVGTLERLGLPLDWALNLPSFLGFFGLLILIYLLGKHLFGRQIVGVLGVIFFLFNGSLSFTDFFSQHPLSTQTLSDIVTSSRFASFGPWGPSPVSAFWTLNIYTNQRHLAFSYALGLLVILLIELPTVTWPRRKKLLMGLSIGLVTGLLVFTNHAVLAIAALWLLVRFFTKWSMSAPLLLTALVGAIFFLIYAQLAGLSSTILWHPGYLTRGPLTIGSFFNYWWLNLGLNAFFIPLGLLLAPRRARPQSIPLIILFIIPNLWQFSPDMINNHKFFNFFLILGNLYTAWALIKLGNIFEKISLIKLIGPIGLIFVSIFLTLSGFIDLFPVLNERPATLSDTPKNRDIDFFLTQTNPTDITLNSTMFYHPASLSGRPVFMGYSYFVWSYGYNQTQREDLMRALYGAANKVTACQLLQLNNIRWVELNDNPEAYLPPNRELWDEEFTPAYRNDDSGVTVYNVKTNCQSVSQKTVLGSEVFAERFSSSQADKLPVAILRGKS